MTDTTVRFFGSTDIPVFRLSPLYAEPGWYTMMDAGRSAGPYRSREELLRAIETRIPGPESKAPIAAPRRA